jgi:hypothetical protein
VQSGRRDTGNAGNAGDADDGGRLAADAPAADGADALAARFDAWLALTGQTAAAGPLHLPMLSGSMWPALPVGCVLEIAPADGSRVRPGDVVVLARDGRLVAHRVLLRADWFRGGRLLEMGDANRRARWRPVTDVVGRVRAARAADGTPLPDPFSRRHALRGLLRHLRGWLGGETDDDPLSPADGDAPHDA